MLTLSTLFCLVYKMYIYSVNLVVVVVVIVVSFVLYSTNVNSVHLVCTSRFVLFGI